MALYLIIELNSASYTKSVMNIILSVRMESCKLFCNKNFIQFIFVQKDFGPRWCSIAAATLVSVWQCILGDVQTYSTFT